MGGGVQQDELLSANSSDRPGDDSNPAKDKHDPTAASGKHASDEDDAMTEGSRTAGNGDVDSMGTANLSSTTNAGGGGRGSNDPSGPAAPPPRTPFNDVFLLSAKAKNPVESRPAGATASDHSVTTFDASITASSPTHRSCHLPTGPPDSTATPKRKSSPFVSENQAFVASKTVPDDDNGLTVNDKVLVDDVPDQVLPPFATWPEAAPTSDEERCASVSRDGWEWEWALYSHAGDGFRPIEVSRQTAFRLQDGTSCAGTADSTPSLPEFLATSLKDKMPDKSRPHVTIVYVLMVDKRDLIAIQRLLSDMPVKLYRLRPTDIVPEELRGPGLVEQPTALQAAVRGAIAVSLDIQRPTLLIYVTEETMTAFFVAAVEAARLLGDVSSISQKLEWMSCTSDQVAAFRTNGGGRMGIVPLVGQSPLETMLFETRDFVDRMIVRFKNAAGPAIVDKELKVLVGDHEDLDSSLLMDMLDPECEDLVEPVSCSFATIAAEKHTDLISRGVQQVLLTQYRTRRGSDKGRAGLVSDMCMTDSGNDRAISNESSATVDGGTAMDFEFGNPHDPPHKSEQPEFVDDVQKALNAQTVGVTASSESVTNLNSLTAHTPEFVGVDAQDAEASKEREQEALTIIADSTSKVSVAVVDADVRSTVNTEGAVEFTGPSGFILLMQLDDEEFEYNLSEIPTIVDRGNEVKLLVPLRRTDLVRFKNAEIRAMFGDIVRCIVRSQVLEVTQGSNYVRCFSISVDLHRCLRHPHDGAGKVDVWVISISSVASDTLEIVKSMAVELLTSPDVCPASATTIRISRQATPSDHRSEARGSRSTGRSAFCIPAVGPPTNGGEKRAPSGQATGNDRFKRPYSGQKGQLPRLGQGLPQVVQDFERA